MNDPHIAHFIRQHLNRGARALPENVVVRLRKAREAALARQRQSVYGAVLATIGARFDLDDQPRQFAGFIAVLALSIACVAYWHGQQYIAGLEEVDSAILTDEMPLGTLVDKGFDVWLRSSADR